VASYESAPGVLVAALLAPAALVVYFTSGAPLVRDDTEAPIDLYDEYGYGQGRGQRRGGRGGWADGYASQDGYGGQGFRRDRRAEGRERQGHDDEGGWRGAGYRDGYDSRGEGGWIGDAAAYDGYDGNRENAADHRGRRDF